MKMIHRNANRRNNKMENNFDHMPEGQETKPEEQNTEQQSMEGQNTERQNTEGQSTDTAGNTKTDAVYTDPNAGTSYQQPYSQYTNAGTGGYTQYTSANTGSYNQNQSYGYQQQEQNYTNYQQQEQNYTNYQQQEQNYANYQQQYQDNYNYNVNTPSYNQNPEGQDSTPLSMGEWLLTLILLAIPCLNIVLYIVWAFGKNGNINRRNYCRAGLILAAAGYVIAIIVVIIIAVAGGIGGYYYY